METAFHDGMSRSCIIGEDVRRGCGDADKEQLEVLADVSEMLSY
jgi:hypothetical protein